MIQVKRSNSGTVLRARKKEIDLRENKDNPVCLTNEEREILQRHYAEQVICIPEVYDGEYSGSCRITKQAAKDYVGYIDLPTQILRLTPKINILNISYMFQYAYGLEQFKDEELEYLQENENTMFELLVKRLLIKTEKLCREGISKTYYECEDNLPYIKGKILYKENAIHNSYLKHRVYCRYSEFGPDNTENRIIKHTLCRLMFMHLKDQSLYSRLRFLLQYFEPVSLKHFDFNRDLPNLNHSSLTMRYESILNLCKVIMTQSSPNLSDLDKEVKFSSYLEDMNKLFESFIFGLISSRIKKNLIIRRGKKARIRITEVEGDDSKKKSADPDILIGYSRQRPLVVIDAKYKRETENIDLYQIWIYAIALGLPVGILIYPSDESIYDNEIALKNMGTLAHILTIDLNTSNYQDFEKECSRFASSINQVSGIPDLLETTFPTNKK